MYKKRKFYSFLCLLFITVTFTHFKTVLADDITTIIDSETGDYISGPEFSEDDIIIRLALQKDNYKDAAIYDANNNYIKNYTSIRENISVGQIVKVKNIGTLYGEPITFCISPVNEGNSIEISTYIRPIGTTISIYDYWIEDAKGNILNDENVVFLMTYSSGFVWADKIVMEYTNLSTSKYFIRDNKTSVFEVDNKLNTLTVKETGFSGPKRNMTVGFRQLGDKMRFKNTLPRVGVSNAIYLLDLENTTGIRIPYQRPVINETWYEGKEKDDWAYAKLKVTQELPRQSYSLQYPDPLELVVDIDNELIKKDEIVTSDITIKSGNQNISVGSLEFPTTGTNAGKLVATISRAELLNLKDDRIEIEGLLPLNLEHPDIYKNLDSNNYRKIEGGFSLKKIEDKNKEKEGIVNPLYTKIPAPKGKAVEGTAVYQYTTISALEAEDLVTDLESYIPNDEVKIVGFKDPTHQFSDAGIDTVLVVIESKITGIQTAIPVKIQVISKDLDLLHPMEIIPDSSVSDLTYTPIFEQEVKSGSSTTLIDNVVLTTTFVEGVNVEKEDFKVYVDGDEIFEPIFVPTLNESDKTYSIKFSNTDIKKYFGKTIEIKQTSSLEKANTKILDYYSKTSEHFEFPIIAYHSFGEKDQNWTYTQNPKSKNSQIIPYKPVIQANPVQRERVEVGTSVKNPEDYIATINDLDFDFDEYVYSFENKPNFSTPGEKQFNIIVESKYFGFPVKVPVIVDVAYPNVELTINYYQWIDGKESVKSVVEKLDNGTRKKQFKDSVVVENKSIQEMLDDEEELQAPKITGYTFNPADLSKIKITLTSNSNQSIQLSEKIPTEDFTINYYYEPTLELNVPANINFGVREKRNDLSVYGMVPSKTETNNSISIIDTHETSTGQPDWSLYASTEGVYSENNGVRLLADIMLKTPDFSNPQIISDESTPLYEGNNEFKKDILLADEDQEKGLFIKVAKVQELGKYTGVLKYKLQAAP